MIDWSSGKSLDRAPNHIYHVPNQCKSQGISIGGFLCLLLSSGRLLTPTSRHNFIIFLPSQISEESLYNVTHGLHNANRLPSSIWIDNTMSGAKRKCSNDQITSALPTSPSVSSPTLHPHPRYFFTLWWVILFTCYHQNSS